MKRLAFIGAGAALGFVAYALFFCGQPSCLNGTAYAVFSPNSDDAILPLLDSAKTSIDVELYQFSNPDFKQSLANAAYRGVKVRVILEPRVDSNYETASFLADRGVEVRWATLDFTNTHSKYAVIDGETVIVGSANWSKHAMESNREAGVVVQDARIAQDFSAAFGEDWLAGQQVAS